MAPPIPSVGRTAGIGALVVLVAALGIIAALAPRGGPPAVVELPIQHPEPRPPPVVEDASVEIIDAGHSEPDAGHPVALPPHLEVDAGMLSPRNPTVKKPPLPQGPTRDKLEGRLSAFEKRLAAHEKTLGDKDALLRGLLDGARSALKKARSPADLTAAEKKIAGLEQQL